MAQTNDLNKLSRRMYLTYQQDGLIEIAAGAAIMGLGAWYFNASTVVAFISLLPFIFYSRLKNWITVPRLGVLKISPKSANRRSTLVLLAVFIVALLIFSILGALGLVGLLPAGMANFFKQPFLMLVLLIALVIAVVGLALALRWGGLPILWVARVFVYAAIYLVIIVADIGFRITNGPLVTAVGAIIFIVGLGELFIFISRNPISRPEGL
jgi:hypothetical protein